MLLTASFDILREPPYLSVMIGVLFGVIARVLMLQTDYRQYPTYPHGKIIHIALGIIAAGLGALVVPALMNKEYTAVTFLALAAQQFRDVRNMERQSLMQVEDLELVPRGAAYIEGIAMVFEGRNYLVIFSSLVSSGFAYLFAWYWGALAGILSLIVVFLLKSGKSIGHIAKVELADIRLDGPDLYVGNVYIMNIGLRDDGDIISREGRGILLHPKNASSKVTLSNLGQRQALLHNVSVILGVYRDSGEPALLPLAKLDMENGVLALFTLPRLKDPAKIKEVVSGTPILENAVRMPKDHTS